MEMTERDSHDKGGKGRADDFMGPTEIAAWLEAHYPEEVIGTVEFSGQVSVLVRKRRIREIMKTLQAPPFSFEFLEDLCGVDYLGVKTPRFEVVYHLFSFTTRQMIRIKAEVTEEQCVIDSVVDLWAGASWFERECYDMFGIRFEGHPDLRRVLMPEDWEGYPLRKDYPLKSDLGEREWSGYRDVLETAEKNRRYEVR
jgi:NADH-quinone oxidoreductase subunit C